MTTVWLSEAEQRVWRQQLAIYRRLTTLLEQQMQAEVGLSHAYYVILAMLSEAPGRQLRMSELAAQVTASPSRVSHAVDRLVERGWVERRKVPEDRRGAVAVLTDEGMAVLEAAAPGHVRLVRENLFDLLTPEQLATLEEIYGTLLERLEGHDDRERTVTAVDAPVPQV